MFVPPSDMLFTTTGPLGGIELWSARAAIELSRHGYATGILTAEYEPGPPERAARRT